MARGRPAEAGRSTLATRFTESAIATSFVRTPPSSTSTEAAHPRTMFEYAECVDFSGASTRSRRSSVTMAFSHLWAREIVRLEAKEWRDAEDAKETHASRRKLEDENEAISDLEAFYDEVKNYWSDINLHRNIGHVQYAAAITVDVEGGTLYTSHWAAFVAAEAKVRDEFEGNVVNLGAFRLIFLIFTLSNENNFIQDRSILLKNLRRSSILWVVRPR